MTAQLNATGSVGAGGKKRSRGLRGLVAVGAVGALLVASAGSASAATDTGNTTANVDVTVGIVLSGLTPSFTLTGAPGATPTANVSYTVTTNNPAGYSVSVLPNDPFLAPTAVGNTDSIPIADLLIGGVAMTGGSDIVQTKNAPSAALGDPYTDVYSITIPFVTPDTYTQTIAYTATTL